MCGSKDVSTVVQDRIAYFNPSFEVLFANCTAFVAIFIFKIGPYVKYNTTTLS
jgi:hypothetical protein